MTIDTVHPWLPMCSLCDRQSATFAVLEFFDVGSRSLSLCMFCLRSRALNWERFAVQVHVTCLDQTRQSS